MDYGGKDGTRQSPCISTYVLVFLKPWSWRRSHAESHSGSLHLLCPRPQLPCHWEYDYTTKHWPPDPSFSLIQCTCCSGISFVFWFTSRRETSAQWGMHTGNKQKIKSSTWKTIWYEQKESPCGLKTCSVTHSFMASAITYPLTDSPVLYGPLGFVTRQHLGTSPFCSCLNHIK